MPSDAQTPVVYRGGRVYAPAHPGATAVVVRGRRIVFVGSDAEATSTWSGARQVDVRGALMTPAFVDAHLHTIQLGRMLDGLDLHAVASRAELLDRLAAHVRGRTTSGVVVGQGWDERGWPESAAPTRQQVDRAAGGVPVYLARVDVHSAVVSTALLARLPMVEHAAGYRADGFLTQDAHHLAQAAVDSWFTAEQRREAARLALRRCAEVGVATVHELSGPHLGPIEDFDRVREAAAEVGIGVVCYWGELADEGSVAAARRAGARGLAGDLCIDGSIGSHTAALSSPYADHDGRGVRYLDDEEITGHIVACTRSRLQAGFHCIGDDAVSAAVAGLRRAAELIGVDTVRAARHRLEHVEMISADQMATLAELDVVASMQPAFDAAWGGPGELYEQRLGATRSMGMNPLGSLRRAGVSVAYGTDAPVTPAAGWATVRAAVTRWQPSERVSVPAAFEAATRGGHCAAGDDRAGVIGPGQRADLAIWDTGDLPADASGLPEVDGSALPELLVLLAGGRVVVDRGSLGPTQ